MSNCENKFSSIYIYFNNINENEFNNLFLLFII